MPPKAITDWLRSHYPKPDIDPEWLQACYDWIIDEKHLNPATDMQQIIQEVEYQLLESDLRDSMIQGTGIPLNVANPETKISKLTGPILVQIEAITDVGTSAHNLNKTRLLREERREAGEEQEGEADGEVEGEGPIPSYSRSMLKLQISDGATTLQAAEYRPIPELVLGVTPLGYKLQIQNAEVRRGVIFLEPRNITLKGQHVADREMHQGAEFARGLRQRLGLPEPNLDRETAQNPPNNGDIRSPLREISPPPSPTLIGSVHPHSDDEDQPRRRRVPNAPASSVTSSSTFFNDTQRASSSAKAVGEALSLSPLRPGNAGPTIIQSDDEDEENWQVAARPIKPMPARARTSTSSANLPSPDKGKEKAADSDYDDMFEDLPSSFFEEAAQIEIEQGTKSMPTPSAQAAAGSSMGATRFSTDEPSSASYHVVSTEVITIDDDEEEDKENVPVPTRHVRRRTAARPVIQMGEVIDLSDSD